MNWFFAAGDAPFFFLEQLNNLLFFPDLWRGQEEFGISSLPLLWIDYPFRLVTGLFATLGFSWFVIDKLWWALVLFLVVYGTYKLGKTIGIPKGYRYISILVYSCNTYILLLFDGGQIGVALAYAFVPWVLSSIMQLLSGGKSGLRLADSLYTGMLLSVLVFLDVRIAYVFIFLLIPLLLVLAVKKKIVISKEFFVIPILVLLINAFWLIPSIQYKTSLHSVVTQTMVDGSDLSFFSVADFPHSLSLLHPNYPENLFGKVYFFKPEFLVIPIVAFSILLLSKISIVTVGLGLTALFGAFLGKGTQEPFGGMYELLFEYVPGFFLFRDPTKWYLFTAIAYAILIPQSLSLITLKVSQQVKRFKYGAIQNCILMIFIVFWIFTLRFVFLGQVTGNITPPKITSDYIHLKDLLVNDSVPGRTLWLPSVERFGYASEVHPALSASSIFSESSPSGIIREFDTDLTINLLRSVGVAYIIVPQDVEKKIFLDDYKYSSAVRDALITKLDAHASLSKLLQFQEIAVYRIQNHQSFFTINTQSIKAILTSKDMWNVMFPERPQTSIFSVSMAYDPNWRLFIAGKEIEPFRTENKFMSFSIPEGAADTGLLTYLPTESAKAGAILSLFTISLTVVILVFFRKK